MSNISFDLGRETWIRNPLYSLSYSFWLLNGMFLIANICRKLKMSHKNIEVIKRAICKGASKILQKVLRNSENPICT